jgi:hypothetical protein
MDSLARTRFFRILMAEKPWHVKLLGIVLTSSPP